MLDSFIIEELKRREEQERRRHERPALRLPVPGSDSELDLVPPSSANEGVSTPERGVVVIDI